MLDGGGVTGEGGRRLLLPCACEGKGVGWEEGKKTRGRGDSNGTDHSAVGREGETAGWLDCVDGREKGQARMGAEVRERRVRRSKGGERTADSGQRMPEIQGQERRHAGGARIQAQKNTSMHTCSGTQTGARHQRGKTDNNPRCRVILIRGSPSLCTYNGSLEQSRYGEGEEGKTGSGKEC